MAASSGDDMRSRLGLFALLLIGMGSASGGTENEIRAKPPGSDLTVVLSRESDRSDYWISILGADGKKVLSQAVDLSVSPIVWNRQGTLGAFSGGTPFLMDCYVVVLNPPVYRVVKLPAPKPAWDNYHSIPVKWADDVLQLRIDGPHAGKAGGYDFSGYMKVSVGGSDRVPKVINEKIHVRKTSAE